MAALAAQLAALSKKADELLEVYHQELFASGLDVSFNRAALATKYWLPLPESLKSTRRTADHEDEHPQDDSDEQIHSALRECESNLRLFESSVKSKLEKTSPIAASAFAQSVRKISRMIDARRQSSDSDSDSSSPGSTSLYTRDAGKAGPKPKPQGQTSRQGSTGDESLRPSAAPEESTQLLTSNIQTYEPIEYNIRKRPSSSAGNKHDGLSSPRRFRNQSYSPQSQNNDASQPLHSVSDLRNKLRDFDRYPLPEDSPSPEPMIPGRPFAPEDQYGHASTRDPTRPYPGTHLQSSRDHTTDQLDVPIEIDPSGETKVSKDGHPLGGRIFRCRTFQLPDRGQTLFMLSTECEKVLGYRNAGLLFEENKTLLKIIVTRAEREDLMQQEIVSVWDTSTQVAVVTARSMFRQFGARLIENGRRVQDDYWEAKAREQGFTAEDAASETTPGAAKVREAMAAQSRSKFREGFGRTFKS